MQGEKAGKVEGKGEIHREKKFEKRREEERNIERKGWENKEKGGESQGAKAGKAKGKREENQPRHERFSELRFQGIPQREIAAQKELPWLPGNSGGPRNSPFLRDFHVHLPYFGLFPGAGGFSSIPRTPEGLIQQEGRSIFLPGNLSRAGDGQRSPGIDFQPGI